MIAAPVQYPRTGLLLAFAFDKAVGATLRSWPWVVAIVGAGIAGAFAGLTQAIVNLGLLAWAFVAAANAMRTIRPEYRMDGGTGARMFLTAFATGIIFILGFLALIWPGIYLATKLSVAQAAAVMDGLPAELAMRRSWEMTRERFWPFLGFFVVLTIASTATTVIPSFLLGGFAGALVTLHVLPVSMETATGIATGLASVAYMYAVQAEWIAGMHWYRALKAMQEAELAQSALAQTPATA
ncbi:MAG: glycerophosphoryl diester phosphodiesterase membrane domain-containing protein [Candidatus Eremiobacteraeota bacterium]|nr:glycerophosphoryl diester phosphodiesterase membrane domain-containing protein [Candidatus Eremiobacteraeota bacterium]MBV8365295.1 glycerophosphoryl diester phosphodiesterase membrane domain-containing protein [Candidatus Eremiobacteraeota bacterium]